MSKILTAWDRRCFERAVELALLAEREGNLPIGAVISLEQELVAEGRNAIWSPSFDPSRHAEMEALRALPEALRERGPELTLYTTLEPCLMCRGGILLHGVGRVLFGAADPYGGAASSQGLLPVYFRDAAGRAEWMGPVLEEQCGPLYQRTMQLLEENN